MKVCYSKNVASPHKTWHSQPPSNIVIEQKLELFHYVVVIYQVFHKSVQNLTDCVHFKGLSPFRKMRSMSNWICSLIAWLNFFWKDGDQLSGSNWTQMNTYVLSNKHKFYLKGKAWYTIENITTTKRTHVQKVRFPLLFSQTFPFTFYSIVVVAVNFMVVITWETI